MSYEYPVTYKGANVSFVKQIVRQTANDVYCGCVQPKYKKFVTAENNPHISNARRISQILSSSSATLGAKTNFGNVNNNRAAKYNNINAIQAQPQTIVPIRNKF
jgi:hypothetical protein